MLQRIGHRLAQYLSEPRVTVHLSTSRAGLLLRTLRKGDVLLVEGTSHFAVAIRYITQSTWSHSALCVSAAGDGPDGAPPMLIEADVNEGVHLLAANHYAHQHTRICRPIGLTAEELDQVVASATARLGEHYDTRNVVDLARYLIHTPPVPERYRRRLLAFGSGEPTRAICSSLIAAAFESVRYPILPEIEQIRANDDDAEEHVREILHIRDSRLFTPRDFDVSPYFRIVKPTLEDGFDPHALHWAHSHAPGIGAGASTATATPPARRVLEPSSP